MQMKNDCRESLGAGIAGFAGDLSLADRNS
jgi:hypothetical protein